MAVDVCDVDNITVTEIEKLKYITWTNLFNCNVIQNETDALQGTICDGEVLRLVFRKTEVVNDKGNANPFDSSEPYHLRNTF